MSERGQGTGGGPGPREPFDETFYRDLILETFAHARWTQDTPIVPDLWLVYMRGADAAARAAMAGTRVDAVPGRGVTVPLLITPWEGASAGAIADAIRRRLEFSATLKPQLVTARVATSTARVVADLDLRGLVRAVVPLTGWWSAFTDRFVPARPDPLHPDRPPSSTSRLDRDRDDADEDPDPLPAQTDLALDAASEVEVGIDDGEGLGLDRFHQRAKAPDGAQTLLPAETIDDLFVRLTETPEDGVTAVIREFLRYVVLVGFVERLAACTTVEAYAALRSDGLVLLERLPSTAMSPSQERRRAAFGAFRRAYAATVATFSPFARVGPRNERRVWLINPNRSAHHTVVDSRRTAKFDAAERLFEARGKGITFAVVDAGIDALHPGFRRNRPGDPATPSTETREQQLRRSRIVRTYDFTQLRRITGDALTDPDFDHRTIRAALGAYDDDRYGAFYSRLRTRANIQRNIDWELIEPVIRVESGGWFPPTSPHGTHVAGILGADLPPGDVFDRPIVGMCPDIELWDLRVFDPETGESDEFTVTAALDFVRWFNRGRERPQIQGVNLSLALFHAVSSFACGQTPICETCNRLVAEGVVVVASAGNAGWDAAAVGAGLGRGYNTVSITDPGNAAGVLTVGSTHRLEPHAYGVSYFSSRGPTGDGRRKPDLLAPGEKIWSLMPGGRIDRLDGTSMAAPHVAGAAALMMARYPELIGRPEEIKRILMATATDLGREPNFQGAGLVDVLRALQSV